VGKQVSERAPVRSIGGSLYLDPSCKQCSLSQQHVSLERVQQISFQLLLVHLRGQLWERILNFCPRVPFSQ